jgi:ABC-type long-subunit fatty acid transport system fused permease/ATPase subunit
MKSRRSVFKTVVAPIVAVVVFIPTLANAVREVLHGRGAATYLNFYGLAIPYTSVLILVLVIVLTLAVAYVARLVYFWRSGHDGSAKLRKIDSPSSSVDSDEGA